MNISTSYKVTQTPYNENYFGDVVEETDSDKRNSRYLNQLGIELEQFCKIPTLSLKKEFLCHHLVKNEIEIFDWQIDDNVRLNKLNSINRLFNSIIKSRLFSNHQDIYSPLSGGLSQINSRTTYNVSLMKMTNDDLNQSILIVGEKKSGVEPGFQATLKKDICSWIFHQYPNAQKRWEFIKNYGRFIHIITKDDFNKKLTYELENSFAHTYFYLYDEQKMYYGKQLVNIDGPSFHTMLSQTIEGKTIDCKIFLTRKRIQQLITFNGGHSPSYKSNIDCIALDPDADFPLYLFKNSYIEKNGDYVVPNTDDLKRSHAIQETAKILGDVFTSLIVRGWKLYKTGKVYDLNFAAVREVLGNDMARAYGIKTQTQFLYPGQFEDSTKLLLTTGLWVKGAKDLGGTNGDCLAGDKGDNKYLVKKVKMPFQNISYLSDNSVKNLADKICLLLTQYDWDAIGSKAQNKLRLGDEFIGIDFGKAYEENDDLVKYIGPYFQINHPKCQFKNFSIFYDSTLSEKLKGIIKLIKWKGDISNIDRRILDSYGTDFVQELDQIVEKTDEIIFDDYLKCFKDIGANLDKDSLNAKICEHIITQIENTKKKAINSRNAFIDKFQHYLQITQPEVNLLENLEKVMLGSDQTSLRSPDETVLLHHVRMKINIVEEWDINPSYFKQHRLRAKLREDKYSETAFKNISQWILKDSENLVTINCINNYIVFTFNPSDLSKICQLFSEEKIKKAFHPSDYISYQIYCCETRLNHFLEKYLDENNKREVVQKHSEYSDTYQVFVPQTLLKKLSSLNTTLDLFQYDKNAIQKEDGLMLNVSRETLFHLDGNLRRMPLDDELRDEDISLEEETLGEHEVSLGKRVSPKDDIKNRDCSTMIYDYIYTWIFGVDDDQREYSSISQKEENDEYTAHG